MVASRRNITATLRAYTKLHSNVSLSLSLTSASSETLWFVKFYVRLQLSITAYPKSHFSNDKTSVFICVYLRSSAVPHLHFSDRLEAG